LEVEGRESLNPLLTNNPQVGRIGRGRAARGKPVLEDGKVRKLGDEQQAEKEGNEWQDKIAFSSSKQITLGEKGDETLMGWALGIFVEPVMKLWGGGKRRGAEPETKHKANNENSANLALTACARA